MTCLIQPQVAGLLRAMGGVLDARSALEQMLHVARRHAKDAKHRTSSFISADMVFWVEPQVAGLLRAMGGVLDARSALEQMLHVAAEGDVSKLRMLVQSGIPIDKGPHHIRP